MPSSRPLHFDCFQLDPLNARLLQDGQPVALTPKAFDVLVFLCSHPGELVGKEALLDAVWQRRFISEGVLKNTIQELRRVLGDNPKSPRYIETIHRRGYRFLGAIREHGTPARDEPAAVLPGLPADTDIVVGRDDSLDRLRKLLGASLAGKPQTVFLSGEAGIGKTTLMQRFSALAPETVACVGGQCVEHHGEVEPYLPILEALNQLSRRHGDELVAALRRYAPTWLAQLPWLLDDREREVRPDAAQGLAKERMQREFCAFLDYWTGELSHSLVLMLEDLHWSDHATLDLVACLARRPGPARRMILGSFRPTDLLTNEHPLRQVLGELKLHRRCHDIPLELLPEPSVKQYLERRFAAAPLSARLMGAISRRTEGLPLYLAHLSNELMVWRERHPHCTDREMEAFFDTLPESLKLFIEQLFNRLPSESLVFLDAAAVSGNGFTPAILAAVTGQDALAAEDWCERLARDRHILRRAGPPHCPERRKSGRYAFVHAYYQELAYQRIPMLRRASLHRAVAEWLEAHCGPRARDLAAEVAMHFELGRDYEHALAYFRIAVEIAVGRHEPHAVSDLSRRALGILEQHLPGQSRHAEIAVELYATLAAAVQVTHGWAAPELQPIFDRLLAHEETLGAGPQRLPILWGAMGFHFVRGQLRMAEQLALRMLADGRPESHVEPLVCGHVGLAAAGLYSGRLDFALEHFQASQALYRPQETGMMPSAAIHPMVMSYFFATQIYWLHGFPDQAGEQARQGVAVAQSAAHPFSLAYSQWGELLCRQFTGEADAAPIAGQRWIAEADAQGFALISALAITQQGWTLSRQGRPGEALDFMERGLGMLRTTGTQLSATLLLAYSADACLRLGRIDKAATWLDEAWEIMERNGERYFEAELHRLQGEIARPSAPAEAERHFKSALAIAGRQSALSLALRAAMSLARLWHGQSQPEPARALLQQVYAEFTEGFDSRDLQEARALLAQLDGN